MKVIFTLQNWFQINYVIISASMELGKNYLCNGQDLTTFLCNETENPSPRILLCNGQSHELHTKFKLSKRNFLTRCGLHENYAMSRKLNAREVFYVCNDSEGGVYVSILITFICETKPSLFCQF